MEGALYWTDLRSEQLLRYVPESDSIEVVCEDVIVGGFTIQDDGSLLLFMDKGTVGRYHDGTLTRDLLSAPDIESRFNDVVADPEGRVFCGTMPTERGDGKLLRLNPEGTFTQLLTRVRVPNGMGFSPDVKTLYFTETNNSLIHAFDYDIGSGSINNRETFADFHGTDGKPDGLAVDERGSVWSAQWGSGNIARFSPNGDRHGVITVPATNVTSVAFGGEDGDTLFVTTSLEDSDEADRDGAVYTIETNRQGTPQYYSQIQV